MRFAETHTRAVPKKEISEEQEERKSKVFFENKKGLHMHLSFFSSKKSSFNAPQQKT